MAFQRDLEVDDLRDAHILKAYAEGRLAFRPGLGPVHCPHCSKSVGILLPGDALGRTATARTLLVIGAGKPFKSAVESGDVVVVVPKVRKVSDSDNRRASSKGKVAYPSVIEHAQAVFDAERKALENRK